MPRHGQEENCAMGASSNSTPLYSPSHPAGSTPEKRQRRGVEPAKKRQPKIASACELGGYFDAG